MNTTIKNTITAVMLSLVIAGASVNSNYIGIESYPYPDTTSKIPS